MFVGNLALRLQQRAPRAAYHSYKLVDGTTRRVERPTLLPSATRNSLISVSVVAPSGSLLGLTIAHGGSKLYSAVANTRLTCPSFISECNRGRGVAPCVRDASYELVRYWRLGCVVHGEQLLI